jgi:hypothetical protein
MSPNPRKLAATAATVTIALAGTSNSLNGVGWD